MTIFSARIVRVIIIFLVTIVVLYSLMGAKPSMLRNIWDNSWGNKVMVNLQLHGSYEVDTSGIRNYERIKENTPFQRQKDKTQGDGSFVLFA